MRFVFENNALRKVNNALKTINTAKEDAKVNLLLGAQDLGELVRNSARITTAADQVQVMFNAKKPEGFVVAQENVVNINLNATKFLAILEMTLTYKSDVFFDVSDNQVVIGVEGRCKTPLAIEESGSTPISQSKLLFKVNVTANNLGKLLSQGLAFAADTGDLSYGTVLIAKRGLLAGYSTDGHIFSRALVEADFENDTKDEQIIKLHEMMAANIAAISAENGKDVENYPVSIPSVAIKHLRSLIGDKTVIMFVDDLHIHVQLDADVIYSASLSSKDLPVEMINGALTGDAATQIGVDSATLATGVDYINSIDVISGNAGKFPIQVKPVDGAEGKLILTSDAISDLESIVKPTKVVGNDSFAVAGKYLKAAIDTLSKGGLVVSVIVDKNGRSPIVLNNGTLEAVDQTSTIGMLQVELAKNRGEDSDEATEE